MTILILGNVNHEYGDVSGVHDLLQIPWIPEIAADPLSTYGIEVVSTIRGVYGIKVESDIESLYSLRSLLSYDVHSVYGIKVESDTRAVLGILVESDLGILYNVGILQNDTGSFYSIRGSIYTDILSRYSINLYYDYGDIEIVSAIKVERDALSEYAIRGGIYGDIESSCQLLITLETDTEAPYNISTYNLIYKDVRGVYMLYSPTSETIVTTVLITVNDE